MDLKPPSFGSDNHFFWGGGVKYVYNCSIKVQTGIRDPANLGKDTKIDFLSQILRQLCSIEDLAHWTQMVILFLAHTI